jgi:DNA-directed RNA polymerase subunit RPC12/RpoP
MSAETRVPSDPRRCLNCRKRVDRKFRLTFGDNDDRLHRCPNCDTKVRLRQGTGAGLEADEPDPVEHPERYGSNLPPQAAILADGGETA